MDLLDLNSLRKQHVNYLSALGDFFHHSSSETIAEVSLDKRYSIFVHDYLKMVCLSGFIEDVEEKKEKLLAASKLEKSAQSSPMCIDSTFEERCRWIETEEAQDMR